MFPISFTDSGATILTLLIALPLLGAACMYFVPRENYTLARATAGFFAFVTFVASLVVSSRL